MRSSFSHAWCQKFFNMVKTHIGIVVHEQDWNNLKEEIANVVRHSNCANPEQYLNVLERSDESARMEWRKLSQIITIGESYFFRDRSQFQMLREKIIPELLIKNTATKKLKVWSAACSSGEEAYSLAITLREVLPANETWDLVVIGSDINPLAIDRARKASYGAWSFRMEQIGERQKYFNQISEQWQVKDEYKKSVRFIEGNLIQDELPNYSNDLHQLDLIVCRNVFIYFDKETVQGVVKKFYDCLSEGGFLLTGHGEVGRDEKNFERCCYGDLVILRKNKIRRQTASPNNYSPNSSLKSNDDLIVSQESIKANKNSQSKTKTYIQTELLYNRKTTGKNAIQDKLKEITEHCDEAKKCADRGEYVEATSLCHQAINLNSQVPLPHFLLAQIYELNNQHSLAKQCLKKVIYLDHDFTPAYVQLATIYRIEGNVKVAKKMMETALEILQKLPDQSTIPEYSESTVSEMRRYVQQWLGEEA